MTFFLFFAGVLLSALGLGFHYHRRKDRELFYWTIPPILRWTLGAFFIISLIAVIVAYVVAFREYPWYWVVLSLIASRLLASLIFHPIIARADLEESARFYGDLRKSPEERLAAPSVLIMWDKLPIWAAVLYIAGFVTIGFWMHLVSAFI